MGAWSWLSILLEKSNSASSLAWIAPSSNREDGDPDARQELAS